MIVSVAVALAPPAYATADQQMVAPPPAAGAWSPQLDEPLRRALVSGCADGVADLQRLATSQAPGAEIATEVVRLCAEIRAKRANAVTAPPGTPTAAASARTSPSAGALGTDAANAARAAGAVDRSGRSRIIFASSLYGIWAGVALDILAEIDNERLLVLFPMLGGGAGLGASIALTRTGEITAGQAWAVITGLDYGTYSGLLWSAATEAEVKRAVGTALATGVIGGGMGVIAARFRPTQGSVELVRSGGLWSTAGAAMLALMAPDDVSETTVFTMLAAGMDVGLLVGGLLATQINVSRNRMLLIDTGAMTGLLFGLGTTWLIAGAEGHRQAIGAGGMVGLLAGLAIAVVLTNDIDGSPHTETSALHTVPALIARGEDGRWRPGTVAVQPVVGMPGSGQGLTGATASILGGVF